MKTFISPSRDPDFAKNAIHGVNGQRESFKQAMTYLKDRPLRTAVDVGAHIGIWTDLMAEKFERVVAFEPVADNFVCLSKNLAGRTNVALYRGALGDGSTKSARMAMPGGGNSGMWRVAAQVFGADSAAPDAEETPFARLDDFELTHVDLLKIDAEGFEGFVVNGGRLTLINSAPVVVFEDNGLGKRYYRDLWVDPKNVLKELGYRKRFRWRKDEIWSR